MYIDATYRGKCIVYATIIIFLNLLSFDFICEDSQWTEFQVWMEFKISVPPLRVLLSVCYSTLLPLLKGNEIVLCHLPKTFIFTLPFMSFAHLKFFIAYDGRPSWGSHGAPRLSLYNPLPLAMGMTCNLLQAWQEMTKAITSCGFAE